MLFVLSLYITDCACAILQPVHLNFPGYTPMHGHSHEIRLELQLSQQTTPKIKILCVRDVAIRS